MNETLKVYKGTDKDMKCRGMQYELGKTYESDDAIRCGSKGFHSCEAPMDVFNYYHPSTGARYFAAEADGKVDRTNADDSKVASSKLTLKTEIGIPGIVKAQIEYVKSKTTMEHTDPKQATAGNWGAATAGNSGAATAGYKGAATTGENGIAVCNGGKVRGGLGAVLVIAERDDEGNYLEAKVAHVDGETIKADTWYRLKDGQFVEVE